VTNSVKIVADQNEIYEEILAYIRFRICCLLVYCL